MEKRGKERRERRRTRARGAGGREEERKTKRLSQKKGKGCPKGVCVGRVRDRELEAPLRGIKIKRAGTGTGTVEPSSTFASYLEGGGRREPSLSFLEKVPRKQQVCRRRRRRFLPLVLLLFFSSSSVVAVVLSIPLAVRAVAPVVLGAVPRVCVAAADALEGGEEERRGGV